MEEKDIAGIASAVSAAIGKLNADMPKNPGPSEEVEVFICPECGTEVKAMTPYCPNCGCPLEWKE